jgi:beta-lactamase class A
VTRVRAGATARARAGALGLGGLLAAGALLPPRGASAQEPQGAPRAAPGRPAAAARADTARLRQALDSIVGAYEGARRGVVGYAVHNLDTGERLAHRADEPFPTASLVKVPVLVTVYDLVERGLLRLDDPLTVLKIDQVPGAGQLQFMRPGLAITVADAAWLMITTSDNTATNLLLDRVGLRRVGQRMEALGLPRTKIHAKVFQGALTSVAPDSSAKYGLGVTTPHEMARLFALLADGRAVSPAADSAMRHVLAHNTDDQLLQRHVSGVPAAHKTGATDQVRTECSLWRLQSRVVACVLTRENQDTRWIVDSEPQLVMAALGRAITGAWPRATQSAAAAR